MWIFYFLFFFFLINTAYCQVYSADTIADYFEKEFSERSESNNEFSLVTPPEILPSWFFNPPQHENDILYAIGISDPWIDKERAEKQAEIRAFSIASFMNKTASKGVSDVFTESGKRYKFEQLSRFIASQNIDLHELAIDSFVTKYKEKIVL